MALRRSLCSGLVACLASATVSAGVPASVAQAVTAAQHVTVSQLRAALPAASQVPRLTVRLGSQTRLKGVFVVPCRTLDPVRELPLPGSRDVAVDYDGPNVSPISPKQINWLVDLVSLPSPAAARAAMVRIAAAEKTCPVTWSRSQGDGYPPLVSIRTVVRKESAGGWTGYVTVTKLVFLDEWLLQTYLTRGNVLLELDQTVPDLPGTGPRQQAWRKASTKILLARLAHLVP